MKTKRVAFDINLYTPAEFFDRVINGMRVERAYTIYHKDIDKLTTTEILREITCGVGATHYSPIYGETNTIRYRHHPVDYIETREGFCKKYNELQTTFIVVQK